MKQHINIFLTGATGCVGQYILEQLSACPYYKVTCLIRDLNKFKIPVSEYKNVTLVKGDLLKIDECKSYFQTTDILIHTATSWGGHEPSNIDAVMTMLDLLDHQRIQKIILFSTASIMGRGNHIIPEAEQFGTSYVHSKYQIYQQLQDHKLNRLIYHIFPTIILGGDENHPYTHVSRGLKDIKKTIRWLKYLSYSIGFHFIHAEDIAKIVLYLCENSHTEHDLILGNEYYMLKDFIREVAEIVDRRPLVQITIPRWFIMMLIKLKLIKVSDWDKFCLSYRYFKYRTINCRLLNIESDKDTVRGLLTNVIKEST